MRQPVGAASAPWGDAVSGMVRGLVPRTVSLAVTDPRADTNRADPAERACLPRVAPARLRDFEAGRAAARAALRGLGREGPVAVGPGGAPVWPEGVVGSIAHCSRAALAVVARDGDCLSLGVDVEEDRPLAADLVGSVCGRAERARLPVQNAGRAAMAVFCAKEAAYKCQYPLTGQLLDFDAFEVTFDGEDFAAVFTRRVGRFAAGAVLEGRIARGAGVIVALVAPGP